MATESQKIVSALQDVLNHLTAIPYPHVENPTGCKKRASVAIVVRIRPAFEPLPELAPNSSSAPSDSVVEINRPGSPSSQASSSSSSSIPSIDEFFAQQWVKEGDAEVLFIKRAGRAGDRWSGHVALPGGRRDPEDVDDAAAAIRETKEEVGIDLSGPNCLRTGNLPERIVAARGGGIPLMVLCPYIFLLTEKDVPSPRPQPTEVAAAHWVPLRALLSPALRTQEYVDTASSMAQKGGILAQTFLRLMIGRMVFSAIRLLPAESVYASSIPGFVPSSTEKLFTGLATDAFGTPSSTQGLANQQPLLLWGLTLGVMADFLDMLPPYNAVRLWKYPTFTPPDLRLFVYLFTYSVRRNNAADLSAGTWPHRPARRRPSQTAMDAVSHAVAVTDSPSPSQPLATHSPSIGNRNEVGIAGLGVGSNPKDAVGRLLSGYYTRMNFAIAAFMAFRVVLCSTSAWYLYRVWNKRRSRL